jgi:hypothetical protein
MKQPVLAAALAATLSLPAIAGPDPDIPTSTGNPPPISADTIAKWSAPYRGWHYHPDHVIPAKPGIDGYGDVKMTDVPTMFQLPGDPKWHMSFKWEKDCIYQPWLVEHEGRCYNFYNAAKGQIEQLGLAVSDNLMDWRRHPQNPVIPHGPKGSYNQQFSADAKVFRDGDHWVAFFFGVGNGGAHIMAAFSRDLLHWTVDPEPLYKAGGNPAGLDKQYAHKISLVWNPANETCYMFYNAVGKQGRGIGLITSKPLAGGG